MVIILVENWARTHKKYIQTARQRNTSLAISYANHRHKAQKCVYVYTCAPQKRKETLYNTHESIYFAALLAKQIYRYK